MRRLAFFATASLVAHLALVFALDLRPAAEPPPTLLTARLERAEPPQPSAVRAADPSPARALRAPRKRLAPAAPPATKEPALPGDIAALPPPVYAGAAPEVDPPAVDTAAPTLQSAQAPDENKPAQIAGTVASLPRKGELTYVLYLGNDRFSVGQTVQSWNVDSGSYHLKSVSETTGLASVFKRERRVFESRGKLTAGGLQPETFLAERLRSGRTEQAHARFDWSAMQVVLGRGTQQKAVALPPDAQDLVSFMYQLGLRRLAPGRIELPITNGSRLERYELDVGAEELLETPFGALRALPIRQVRRAGRESVEVWLAIDYHLLPVRIRFYGRDGEPSGEQLIADIRVEAE